MAAIDVLKNIGPARKIAILGQMRELGDLQAEQYQKLGQYLVKQEIDIVITYGYRTEAIGTAAIISGMPPTHVKHFLDKEQMHDFLKELIHEHDTILVKGASKTQMFDTVKFISTTIGEVE